MTVLEGLESCTPGVWVVKAVQMASAGVLVTLGHAKESAWSRVIDDNLMFVVHGERGFGVEASNVSVAWWRSVKG